MNLVNGLENARNKNAFGDCQHLFQKETRTQDDYKSGGKSAQIHVDYVMYRRRNLKKMCDCKVIVNECVAKQHRIVVCKMALMVKKKQRK